jgi:hypothetical protein
MGEIPDTGSGVSRGRDSGSSIPSNPNALIGRYFLIINYSNCDLGEIADAGMVRDHLGSSYFLLECYRRREPPELMVRHLYIMGGNERYQWKFYDEQPKLETAIELYRPS